MLTTATAGKSTAGSVLKAPAGVVRPERLFIADDVDRAIRQALSGDTAWIDQMNSAPSFEWHQVIRDGHGKVRAVLRILGKPDESYRTYKAAAAAAKAKKTQ